MLNHNATCFVIIIFLKLDIIITYIIGAHNYHNFVLNVDENVPEMFALSLEFC